MYRILLLVLIALAPAASGTRIALPRPVAIAIQAEGEGPTTEEIEQAVSALREAFAQKDPAIRIAALNDHRVASKKVVAIQARALHSPDDMLQRAALDALRFTDHKSALLLLHKECKRNSALRGDEQLGPLLFRAIGQHSDPSSIELLQNKLYSETSRNIVRARLYSIANIRETKALETLFEIQRSAKGTAVKKYAREMRLCLIQLTGVDRGESPDRWREWWKENRRDFEVPEKAPLMPGELQRAWDSFWGIERVMPRGDRREDRGGD